MRTDDGTGPDGVVYVCDLCGNQERALVVRPRSTDFKIAIQPRGWFWFDVKHNAGQGKSPRLRADLCSVKCAHEQIDEWAARPVREDTDEGD